MKIEGKVHCFFEQSGTFKNEFIKLGVLAEEYDIQNNFGETDHMDDLFKAIEDAYDGKPSLFDNITKDDLVMAFFPCIYFCEINETYMCGTSHNYKGLEKTSIIKQIIERAKKRQYFYEMILKLFYVCEDKGLRLIVENPYSEQHYLNHNFPYNAKMIDRNRWMRGDWFKKPTQYWFLNCEPTYGKSFQKNKIRRTICNSKSGVHAGICSEERSMISPDYARNFICDFILGKEQTFSERQLFDI